MEVQGENTQEVELGSEIWRLEQEKKDLAGRVKEVNTEYKELTTQMQELLIENGKSSTGHIVGVGEFKLAPKAYLSVTKENMPQFIEHLKDIGDADIVKETIEATTLKAYLGQRVEKITSRFADDEHYFNMICGELGFEDPDSVTHVEVAAKMLSKFGVSHFTEIKISHTKKGK